MPKRKTPSPTRTEREVLAQVLEIPGWHPLTLNQMVGWNRYVVARRKKSDRRIVEGYTTLAGITRATGKRRLELTIVLGPRQRASDPDAYFKSLNDALKHCGALKDDNRQWVELAPVQFERAAEKATRIVLADL